MITRPLTFSWLLSLTLASASLTACMTTGEGGHHAEPGLGEADKAGTKTEPATPETASSAATAAVAPPKLQEPPPPSADDQLQFVRKQTSPSAPFTEADHQFVSSLPSSPTPGSIAEAALALGLVKTVLNPLNAEVPTFQEADIGNKGAAPAGGSATGPAAPGAAAPGATKATRPSLEQLCKERGLNLPDALAENPLLGTAGFAKQIVAATYAADTSPDFKNEVTLALKKQANLWNEVSGGMSAPADAAAAAAAAAPAPASGPAVAAPDANLPPNPADLAGGEGSLGEAQALADRGDFGGAVKRASSIPEGSPLRPQAQEKIKEFSNLGVQELRRKAASAFQAAMPVTDPRTRADYLKQAKGFLEEAITKFPDATQLSTVKDNLRVISRDLEQLEGGGGDKHGG
jgi:hypothetical protein